MFGLFHWKSLFRRNEFESEMSDEFRFHVEARTQELMRTGVPPGEAQRRARLEFGGTQRYSEECREAHRLHWMDEPGRNICFAFRTLRKSPAFCATAVLSLALGVGANTLVFSVINSLLLKPLPVAHPKQLVFVETRNGPGVSFPSYRAFRDGNTSFDGLAGYRIDPMNIEVQGSPNRIWGYLATGNYFDTLGVEPALGRFFHEQDDLHPSASPYAVLSYNSWQARFGGDPKVIGSTLRINGFPYTILGVAPRDFHGTERMYWPEIWVPMMMQPRIEPQNAWLDNIYTWDTWMLGRLKPCVTRARATADLDRISNDLARKYPETHAGLRMTLSEPGLFGSMFRGPVQAFTGGLLLLSGLVLLTACSNLAALMVARGTDRRREIAIRFSIGADRPRIIRQLLTEAVLVALIGGGAGFAIAVILVKILSQWQAPIDFPVQFDVSADWRVFGFAAAVSLIAGALFGLGPALEASRADLNQIMKGSAPAVKMGRRLQLRDVLVAGEIAFCFVLVFACFLSLKGLQLALTLPLGFNPEGVTTAAFDLGSAGYSEAQGKLFQKRLAESLRQASGFTTVGYGNSLPLSIDQSTTSVQDENEPAENGRRSGMQATYYDIAPGYLPTLNVPLLRGRDFTDRDDEHAPLVAIVNQTFARRVMHTEDPVGKAFRYAFGTPRIMVVGLVRDGKYVSLTEAPDPVLFRPIAQHYNPTTTIVVRSHLETAAVVEQVRRQISAMDARLPVYGTRSLVSMLGFALFPMHAAAIALGGFGLLALMLAVTGIYGLIAYAVARRTRELGIRLALGAQRAGILRAVMENVTRLVVAGMIAGGLLAVAAGSVLNAVIYGASSEDPQIFGLVTLAMGGAAAAAGLGPALRALRTDVMSALRYE